MRLTRQRFILSYEIVRAFSQEEVEASYKDMEEMGIARLPYPDIDLITPVMAAFHSDWTRVENRLGERSPREQEVIMGSLMRFVYSDDAPDDWLFCYGDGREKWQRYSTLNPNKPLDPEVTFQFLELMRHLLIVVLATRNIIKETREHKAAQLGIGKGEYASTTTLKIGTITEAVFEGDRPHASPRPHLRRGHIRRQHYGPLNELVKKIWVAPTMVNVDQEFIDRRTAYNVSPQGRIT